MPLQYLKDNYNSTARDWEKIALLHKDIKLMLELKTDADNKLRPSDYRGCICKETADKLNGHIEKSRNEWGNEV